MFQKFFRAIFTVIGFICGLGIFLLINLTLELTPFKESAFLADKTVRLFVCMVCVAVFGIIFYIVAPYIRKRGAEVAHDIETEVQKVPTHDLISGTIGLVVGLLIAFLISQLWNSLNIMFFGTVLSALTYVFMGYLGVTIAMKKGRDILPNFKVGSIPSFGRGNKQKSTGDASPKILDTSVIIDGRIADILKTGFIEGNIVIPEFVLVELRHIADSSDTLKRNRGRRGLDILNKIQNQHGIQIYNTTSEKSLQDITEVDAKLLELADIMNGKVVTNDFNLNKVATIKGVSVLNINELANTLKPVVLPGEEMTLTLIREGKENSQALAYLDDGTMIVVEEGRRYIGQTIDVIVTSVLQTAAGRMIFAKPKKNHG